MQVSVEETDRNDENIGFFTFNENIYRIYCQNIGESYKILDDDQPANDHRLSIILFYDET